MTIDELMDLAEKYNFGEGVPIDYEKAVRYYEQAAKLGNMVAQYNLGLKYHRGVGVSKDSEKCQYWMQKSADQGYEQAINYLSICESQDTAIRVTLKWNVVKGVTAIPHYDSSSTALEEFQQALEKSEQLNFPTEQDLADRRDIFRYLGLITYLQGSSENAYAYYLNGLPISESNDERVLYAYLEMLSKMRDNSSSKYGTVFCNAVEDIYHNAFDKITDWDYKAPIMKWVVREKCGIYKVPRDIIGAEQANDILLLYAIKQEQGSLKCQDNLRSLYDDNLRRISSGKHAVQQQNYTSSSSSSTYNTNYRNNTNKSFWDKIRRKFF